MRPTPSRFAAAASRLARPLAFAALLFLGLWAAAPAAADEPVRRDVPRTALGVSLVDIELPLDFRARLTGSYGWTRNAIDALAFDRFSRPGPAVRLDSVVGSRFAIGRPLFDRVELEVAWDTRSVLSFSAGPELDRQTVGAFIRIRH